MSGTDGIRAPSAPAEPTEGDIRPLPAWVRQQVESAPAPSGEQVTVLSALLGPAPVPDGGEPA